MPQLLVRKIEKAVVVSLRKRASAQGISVEEAHRRVLRDALVAEQSPPHINFLEYLKNIPKDDDGIKFTRRRDLPRKVDI